MLYCLFKKNIFTYLPVKSLLTDSRTNSAIFFTDSESISRTFVSQIWPLFFSHKESVDAVNCIAVEKKNAPFSWAEKSLAAPIHAAAIAARPLSRGSAWGQPHAAFPKPSSNNETRGKKNPSFPTPAAGALLFRIFALFLEFRRDKLPLLSPICLAYIIDFYLTARYWVTPRLPPVFSLT